MERIATGLLVAAMLGGLAAPFIEAATRPDKLWCLQGEIDDGLGHGLPCTSGKWCELSEDD